MVTNFQIAKTLKPDSKWSLLAEISHSDHGPKSPPLIKILSESYMKNGHS